MKNSPSLAALFSGRPMEGPQYQRNNPMNAQLPPQRMEYRTPYNDSIVPYEIPGTQIVDASLTPPPRAPGLTPEQEQVGDYLRGTTTIAMAESERRQGDSRAGDRNGINPPMFMGPRGMNTSLGHTSRFRAPRRA